MTDREFLSAFERCEIPNEQFRHRDHLRLAWIYLRLYGKPEAGTRIAEAIQRHAVHNGAPGKYHETMTLAWMELVYRAMRSLPDAAGFDEILDAFPHLLQKSALAQYYSSGVLESETARRVFVEPDLKPLRPLDAPMALSQDRPAAS
ncbi:MAG TPA: hypothetical protein VEU96_23510 [Bryobacteraceae bacterium]|nr:hypothetical protein [Bryobacteraceae bacterium]